MEKNKETLEATKERVEQELENLKLEREKFKFEDEKRDNATNNKIAFGAIINAYRIIPRLFLTIYGVLVYKLYTWYTSIETTVTQVCDQSLIELYLATGIDPEQVHQLACSIGDVIGGPTTAQTTFVTTVIGLATPLFAFYANTGGKQSE